MSSVVTTTNRTRRIGHLRERTGRLDVAVAGRSHPGDGSQPGADAVRVDGDVHRDPVERVEPPAVGEGGLDLPLRHAPRPEAGRLPVAEDQHEVPPARGESLAQAGNVPLPFRVVEDMEDR